MEVAKSLFSSRPHDGYTGKENHNENSTTVYSDDEESEEQNKEPEERNDVVAGGPFSALTPSMRPQEIMAQLRSAQEKNDETVLSEYQFDEFGFRIEDENGKATTKALSPPLVEDAKERLKWLAHLEFSHNNESRDLSWETVELRLPKTDKLREMVREGIPHSLRPQLWMRFSGGLTKKVNSEISYQDIIKESSNEDLASSKQIEKDLLRTLPGNVCFSSLTSTGIPRLRRILRGIAWLYPDIGYCQGMGMVAASLLLFLEEDDCFWLMCTIVEDLLPASYYTTTLMGVLADQKVLRTLICSYLPSVDVTLRQHDIELSLITVHWFLTIFASVVTTKIQLRLWDIFFFDGSIILFQITLGMLKIKEPVLKELENSAQIFNCLASIPGEIDDIDNLLKVSLEVGSTLTDMIIDTQRRRHLAYLMTDQGAMVGNPESAPNLPKQHLTRRQLKKSKSVIQLILFGDEESSEDIKSKNIRQTELIVDVREAIHQVARHFFTLEPKLNKEGCLIADYSLESHTLDHENYLNVSRNKSRRAKAMLDFKRGDDDELGFRKNDIITIISQNDEDCWVGELNGLRGWFPAKFVQVLDERSKQYTFAGDDSVSEAITDLVRGTLCPTIKQILEHGMKRPNFLG